MGDLELDAAVDAVARKLFDHRTHNSWDKAAHVHSIWLAEAGIAIATALPHIERAVIQRLIEKYEAKAREGSIYIDGVRQRSMFDKTVALLRAELEGDDRG